MIISECCVAWKDIAQAKQMIAVSKESGAGLVKFQLFDAEDDKGKPHYDYVKAHELTFEQAKELFDYGAEIGIEVFFSVFGAKYVDWCEKIGVKRYKLACTYRDEAVLKAIKRSGKSVYISTNTQPYFVEFPACWYYLYCVSDYPAKVKQVPYFRDSRCHYIGFSDHTIGIDAAKIALARGAYVIEKHFTLDRSIPSPDAPWSMEPDELKELVRWDKVCQEIL